MPVRSWRWLAFGLCRPSINNLGKFESVIEISLGLESQVVLLVFELSVSLLRGAWDPE